MTLLHKTRLVERGKREGSKRQQHEQSRAEQCTLYGHCLVGRMEASHIRERKMQKTKKKMTPHTKNALEMNTIHSTCLAMAVNILKGACVDNMFINEGGNFPPNSVCAINVSLQPPGGHLPLSGSPALCKLSAGWIRYPPELTAPLTCVLTGGQRVPSGTDRVASNRVPSSRRSEVDTTTKSRPWVGHTGL